MWSSWRKVVLVVGLFFCSVSFKRNKKRKPVRAELVAMAVTAVTVVRVAKAEEEKKGDMAV